MFVILLYWIKLNSHVVEVFVGINKVSQRLCVSKYWIG